MVYTRNESNVGTRYFALVLGVLYLLIGVMGLIPGLLQVPSPPDPVAIDTLHGDLLGIFPVNIVHTLVHLAVGLWGIMAYRRYDSAIGFARAIGVLFGLLFLMGLIPGARVMFGLAPLHGADVWLHLATSLAGLYFGFVAPRTTDSAGAD